MTRPVFRISLPAVLIFLGPLLALLALVVDFDCLGVTMVPYDGSFPGQGRRLADVAL